MKNLANNLDQNLARSISLWLNSTLL